MNCREADEREALRDFGTRPRKERAATASAPETAHLPGHPAEVAHLDVSGRAGVLGALQRSAGNAAVQRWLAPAGRHPSSVPILQRQGTPPQSAPPQPGPASQQPAWNWRDLPRAKAKELLDCVNRAGPEQEQSCYEQIVLRRRPQPTPPRPLEPAFPPGPGPLPYREATEIHECVRIMGESSLRYCQIEVLGSRPPPEPPGLPLPSVAEIRDIARALVDGRGWSEDEFTCLDELWGRRESGWNPRARNPRSTAYGIPQALPGWKMEAKRPGLAVEPGDPDQMGSRLHRRPLPHPLPGPRPLPDNGLVLGRAARRSVRLRQAPARSGTALPTRPVSLAALC
ncbi:MAG: hypothetical protein GEV03_17045 [Streptosporangiales bacterium]|nr:hypothetical protein [Streptosporangiales bacterium]